MHRKANFNKKKDQRQSAMIHKMSPPNSRWRLVFCACRADWLECRQHPRVYRRSRLQSLGTHQHRQGPARPVISPQSNSSSSHPNNIQVAPFSRFMQRRLAKVIRGVNIRTSFDEDLDTPVKRRCTRVALFLPLRSLGGL